MLKLFTSAMMLGSLYASMMAMVCPRPLPVVEPRLIALMP